MEICGFLEGIRDGRVIGWVYDRKRPTGHLFVAFKDIEGKIATRRCDLARDDVREAGHGRGEFGFEIETTRLSQASGQLYVCDMPTPSDRDLVPWQRLTGRDPHPSDEPRTEGAYEPRSFGQLSQDRRDFVKRVAGSYRLFPDIGLVAAAKFGQDLQSIEIIEADGRKTLKWGALQGWLHICIPVPIDPAMRESASLKVSFHGQSAQLFAAAGYAFPNDAGLLKSREIRVRKIDAKSGEVRLPIALKHAANGFFFPFIEALAPGRIAIDSVAVVRDVSPKPERKEKEADPAPSSLDSFNQTIAARGSTAEAAWLVRYAEFLLRHECIDTAAGLCDLLWPIRDRLSDSDLTKLLLCMTRARRAIQPVPDFSFLLDPGTARASANATLARDRLGALVQACSDGEAAQAVPVTARQKIEAANGVSELIAALSPSLPPKPDDCLAAASSYARTVEPSLLDIQSAQYRKWINKALASFDLAGLTQARLGVDNVLTTFAFERSPKVFEATRVTVCMSAYNAESTIEYAVRSILGQTYNNLRLLVCDDLSTDRTLSILRRIAAGDRRMEVLVSHSNQGTYNIRTSLLERIDGGLVTFQDSDDVAHPQRIARQVAAFVGKGAVAILGSWARMLPDGRFVTFADDNISRMAVVSLMAARATFDQYPYQPAQFGADSDVYERLRMQHPSAVHVLPDVLLFGLWSATSLTMTAGIECSDTGYRSPKRRRFAELCGRQRILGDAAVDRARFAEEMTRIGVFREFQGAQRDEDMDDRHNG